MEALKTDQEILDRIKEIEDDDFFGFQSSDLIGFLSYDAAKPFLEEGVTAEAWNADRQTPTREAVIEKILSYMPFAWEKANDCRGLSAGRSIEHMKAWLWMLGDELHAKLDDIYEFYGKPCLRVICEKYGWDWKQWDDGVWRKSEDDDGDPPPETITV